jgi:small subunit ribosomal protein S8e
MRLKKAEYASVLDPETKKFTKVMLKKVIENPANRHYARMG